MAALCRSKSGRRCLWSNHGAFYRIKTEIAPAALLDGHFYAMPRDAVNSPKRWTLAITYENGIEQHQLENLTLGIGYIFN